MSESKLRADFDRDLASLIAKGEVAYFTDANGEQVLYLTEKGRKRAEDAVQQEHVAMVKGAGNE